MEYLCCTSNTITAITQSNTLGNIELNDINPLRLPCNTPKPYDTDISTSRNNNATYELIKKGKERNEKL